MKQTAAIPKCTQSHLFAVPNTVLSVQYRSYSTVYMVNICRASTVRKSSLKSIFLTNRFYQRCTDQTLPGPVVVSK